MDGAQDSTEYESQEPSSTPAIVPSAVNQSAARNSGEELGASELANLVINPPVVMDASANDDGSPMVAGESPLTMQETRDSVGRDNGKIFTESILSSKLETNPNIASEPSGDAASHGQMAEDVLGISGQVPQSNQSPTTKNLSVKIIARPSPEDSDDNIISPLSDEGKNGNINRLIAKVAVNSYSKQHATDQPQIAKIDTAAPFESVRAAVSRFGGIVDWKAHRAQTVERRKVIQQELEKAHEAIPLYKKHAEEAEEAKLKVLKDLENIERQVEELKLNLERLQKEEEQAKQDSELAKLRVAEIEQGIADEASIAAKAEIDIARARHEGAVAELQSTKDELEQLKKDYNILLAEKDESMKKTEEAISMSKEVEKSVEDLTVDLIAAKESLESAHVAHLEAEEHRIGSVMAKEQDIFNWEKDLKQAEEELEKVTQQLLSSKDLKSKLDIATTLLQDLKTELAAYVDSKSEIGSAEGGNLQDAAKETSTGTRESVEAALLAAKKELEQVNLNIEKATDEVNILMAAAMALKSELEKEKAELAAIQQREGMASIVVASLEAELIKTRSEMAFTQAREKEQREKLMELPKQLQVVAQEAGQANELEKLASDELKRAKEEAELAKAGASTMESRLRAVQKEIEAAKASEKLALAAIKALVESENAEFENGKDSPARVTLSLEEYYELSKKAQEAEEQANVRVAAALSQIDIAKESELTSLSKLEQASREMSQRKEALQDALQKSEEAVEGKLCIEQELRNWRAESKQRRPSFELVPAAVNSNISSEKISESETLANTSDSCAVQPKSTLSSYISSVETGVQLDLKAKKKKKFIFPKIFMFLSKRKKSARSIKS